MIDSSEKTQDPTPRRRQQAREEGQVVHSQDLAAAALLSAGVVVLLTMSVPAIHFLADFMRLQLGGEAWLSTDRDWITSFSWVAGWELAKVLLPVLGVLLLAGVLAHLFQTGFLFQPGKVVPDVNRINPLVGFSRIFSLASVVQMLFGVCKIAVVASVAYWSLVGRMDEILSLPGTELAHLVGFMSDLVLWTSLKVCLGLAGLAILDYVYQFWRHERSLRMTPQEVREELKNMQGNPEVIARRRNVQRELAMNRGGKRGTMSVER
jgi:flagellar biosynthetic protein FlhB